jgi:CBS domain-containing protein
VSRSVADYFCESSGYANLGIDMDRLREGLSEILVSDVMTQDPICVAPETPVNEVATLIRKHRIHRVLVVSPGSERQPEIAGIITLFDLVSLLE